jgi:transcriptional regulator with XRE-family HTH domain
MTELASRIGDRIRSLRNDRGLTQEELAETASISVSYLSMMERGWRLGRLETLLDVAIALSVRLPELVSAADGVRRPANENRLALSQNEAASKYDGED